MPLKRPRAKDAGRAPATRRSRPAGGGCAPVGEIRKERVPSVAQVSNLLQRRLPVGQTFLFTPLPIFPARRAGWKPAKRQTGSPRYGRAVVLLGWPREEIERHAACHAAIRQAASLRYAGRAPFFRFSDFGIRISFGPSLPRPSDFPPLSPCGGGYDDDRAPRVTRTPHRQGRLAAQEPFANATKLRSIWRPTSWLFSGWNWVANTLSRHTAEAKRSPYSVHVTTTEESAGRG